MSKKPDPALAEIRTKADALGAAHAATTARASLFNEEIKAVLAPIYAKHRAGLDEAAAAEAAAKAELQELLDVSPHLFKQPRSIAINGVKCGYRKAEDALDWGDEDIVISRIRKLLTEEQQALLIRSKESLVADALAALPQKDLAAIGVYRIVGADMSFISIGDSDVEKMAKALIDDAIRRQGEDDTKAKKAGKAKVKAGKEGVPA